MTVIASPPILSVSGLSVSITAGDLLAVDELRIDWGRGSMLEGLTPATAAVTVLDRTAGYSFARRTDLVGQPVVLSYSNTGYSTSPDFTGPFANFRGRITDVSVARRNGGGMLVTLSCSSKEVDLANYVAAKGTTWPAETLDARLARIVALLPAGLFSSTPYLGSHGSDAVAPADVSGVDVLTLLRQVAASIGAAGMVYQPGGLALGAVDSIDFGPSRISTGPRASGKVFLASLAKYGAVYVPQAQAGIDAPGLRFDALAYDGPVESPMDSRITRVEVGYKNAAAATPYTAATAAAQVDTTAVEAVVGRRVLAIDTLLSSSTTAAAVAAAWATVAARDARAPQFGPLTYTAGTDGAFPDYWTMRMLLDGYPTGYATFVRGTWLTAIGVRPIVGVLGASITYRAGRWSVSFTPQPMTWDGATAPVPITVATAAANNTIKLANLDPALTFGDCAFIEAGAGITPS